MCRRLFGFNQQTRGQTAILPWLDGYCCCKGTLARWESIYTTNGVPYTEEIAAAKMTHLGSAVVDVAVASAGVLAAAANLPSVLLNGAVVFMLLTASGLAMVMGRHLIIEYAPFIGAHASTFAAIINDSMFLIEKFLKILMVGVELIGTIVSVLSGHTPHFSLPNFDKKGIDAAEVVGLTHELAVRCKAYDTLQTVFLETTRQFASPLVCPAIRHTFPIRTAYPTVKAVAGWLSYDPAPPPYGGNCEPPPGSIDSACVAFGTGFVVVELLVPVYVALLIGQSGLWTALLKLAYRLLMLVVEAFKYVGSFIT